MCEINGLQQCECGLLDYQNCATLNLDNVNAGGLNISFTEDNQTLQFVIKDMMNDHGQMQGIAADDDQQRGTTIEKIFTP